MRSEDCRLQNFLLSLCHSVLVGITGKLQLEQEAEVTLGNGTKIVDLIQDISLEPRNHVLSCHPLRVNVVFSDNHVYDDQEHQEHLLLILQHSVQNCPSSLL